MRVPAALVLVFALAAPLAAHAKHQATPAEAPKVHKVEKVAENVYCLSLIHISEPTRPY